MITAEEIAALTDEELLDAIQNWEPESDLTLYGSGFNNYKARRQAAFKTLLALRTEALRRMNRNRPVAGLI